MFKIRYPLCAPAGENAAVSGGPADTPPAQGSAPPDQQAAAKTDETATTAPTKLKIGDVEYDTPEEVAAAMAELQAELEELRNAKSTTTTTTQAAPPKADEPYDYAVGIFTEPDVALKKLKEEAKAELRAEYEAEKAYTKWWDSFYSQNADLKDMDVLVDSIFAKNYNAGAKLKDMDPAKAMEKLAKLTKEAHAKITKAPAKSGDNRSTIEGGSTPATKTAIQSETTSVTSLSQVIKERQAAKRKAASS